MDISTLKVYIGSDHAGYNLKEELKKFLTEKKVSFVDLGSFSTESVDYPDIAREVSEKVTEEKGSFGVLACGTGTGMAMAANKSEGIRAANCVNELQARLARMHNDANVICLGGRVIGTELAKSILEAFLNTPFSREERHERRVKKIEKVAKTPDKDRDLAD